jgi:hypothetical protein
VQGGRVEERGDRRHAVVETEEERRVARDEREKDYGNAISSDEVHKEKSATAKGSQCVSFVLVVSDYLRHCICRRHLHVITSNEVRLDEVETALSTNTPALSLHFLSRRN